MGQGWRKEGFLSIQNKGLLIEPASFDDKIRAMRTTLVIDDGLLAKAQAYTGLRDKTPLVREALKALIERESAYRLARLGGTERKLKAIPRRRSAA